MIKRDRGSALAKTRRAILAFSSTLAVTLMAMGMLAPAGQAAPRPFTARPFTVFNPLLAGLGPVPLGATTSRTFTLKNAGGATTGKLSVVLVGSARFTITADGCTGITLAAASSCSVTVTYKPTTVGARDYTTLWAYGKKPVSVAVAGLEGTSSPTLQADLSVTNSDGVMSVAPGAQTTYKVVVSNAGPSSVTGASVVDSLPAGITSATYTAAGSGGASGFASGTGNISQSVNLPAGSSVTYTVVASVSRSVTGSLATTATVTAPPGVNDPNLANNSATDTDTLTPQAAVSITKTDNTGTGSVTPGSQITYAVTVSNAGPSNVTGVSVVDAMPAAIASDTNSAVGSAGASGFTASGSGNISDSVNLAVGASVNYTVVATVSSSATPTLTLSNTATATVPVGVDNPNAATPNGTVSATDTVTIGALQTCTTTCTVTSTGPNGATINVVANGAGASGTVQAAVFTGTLGCTPSGNELLLDPNTYEVLSSSSGPGFAKIVTIEFAAPSNAPAISSDQDKGGDGDGDFDDVLLNSQICFQAPYSFDVVGGGTATYNATTGLYTGLLADCPATLADAPGPCHNRAADYLSNVAGVGTTSYDINLSAYIPAGQTVNGQALDPRMN